MRNTINLAAFTLLANALNATTNTSTNTTDAPSPHTTNHPAIGDNKSRAILGGVLSFFVVIMAAAYICKLYIPNVPRLFRSDAVPATDTVPLSSKASSANDSDPAAAPTPTNTSFA